MSRNRWKAAATTLAFGIATLLIGACGSGGEGTTVAQPPPIAPDTAGHLAKLSDRVASDLDAGDTCHAAHAADDLQSAVDEASLPASMAADVDAAARNLVDQVNCPPPPLTEEERKKLEEEQKKQEEHHGGENGFIPPGQAKHGGLGPPGKAKLKGE